MHEHQASASIPHCTRMRRSRGNQARKMLKLMHSAKPVMNLWGIKPLRTQQMCARWGEKKKQGSRKGGEGTLSRIEKKERVCVCVLRDGQCTGVGPTDADWWKWTEFSLSLVVVTEERGKKKKMEGRCGAELGPSGCFVVLVVILHERVLLLRLEHGDLLRVLILAVERAGDQLVHALVGHCLLRVDRHELLDE